MSLVLSHLPLQFEDHKLISFPGGHHSIGLNVAWAMIELTEHPECLTKLMAEIDSADLDDFATVNSRMPYLDAVIMEVNRLHSTVHATLRVMNKDTQLGKTGVTLKSGMLIYLSYRHLHTSTQYWGPAAGEFNPDRFLGGHNKEKPFMAFGYGPRNCVSASGALHPTPLSTDKQSDAVGIYQVGYKFVILAAKIYLATLLKMYKVEVRDHDHEMKLGAILVMAKPVACSVTRRS